MARWCDDAIISERALSNAAAVLGPISDAAAALAELHRRRDLGRAPVCLLRGPHYHIEDRRPGEDAGVSFIVWRIAGAGQRLKEIRADCLDDGAAALRRFAGSDPGDIDVGIKTRHGQLLVAYDAGPHVDLHYPRWTLQLCLAAGRHHQVHCDGASSPVAPGDLMLLDVHQVHSLCWAGQRPSRARRRHRPHVALTWDLPARPDAAVITGILGPPFPAAGDQLHLVPRQHHERQIRLGNGAAKGLG